MTESLKLHAPIGARLERSYKGLFAVGASLLVVLAQKTGLLPDDGTELYRFASLVTVVALPVSVITLVREFRHAALEIDKLIVRLAVGPGSPQEFDIGEVESMTVEGAHSPNAHHIAIVIERQPTFEIEVRSKLSSAQVASALQNYLPFTATPD